MRYHPVGTSDIRVSEIGFGCWTMGGPNWSLANGAPIGWADVNEDEVLAGIKAGLDAGVNHFDNADIYGNGKAERMLGACLKKLGVKRDSVVIATKVGHFKGTAVHAYEPHFLRRQCEQSLRNMGVDAIDIYYLHHDNWAEDGKPGNLPEAAAEMHRLKTEGKIRAIGQSGYSDAGFARSVEVLRPVVFQSWASMLFDNFIRPGSAVQRLMTEHKISFVAFSPLAQGLLLDKFDPDNPPKFDEGDVRGGKKDFQPERLRQIKPKVGDLKKRFGGSVEELASAACRFVAAHPHVCSVIPGFRNEKQARCNVRGGVDRPMSADDAAFCRELFRDLQLRG
jgi:aryl-alcohol dehydrogenase-like predicted oxidoreductase